MASIGNDLAAIRKDLNLSLDDVQEATKIPKDILQSIEDDSIFDQMSGNATYIRSYVRGYAKALSIEESEIIRALDQYEVSGYSGFLTEEEENAENREEARQSLQTDEEDAPEERDEKKHEEDESPKEGIPEDKTRQSSQPLEPPTFSKSPPVSSIDWANLENQIQPIRSGSKIWMGFLIIIIIALAAAFFFFFDFDSGDTSPDEPAGNERQTETTPPADSLQLNIVPQPDTLESAEQRLQSGSAQTLSSLPDTLSIVVYAAYGKLEPARVYTDIMNDINPYWLEQGEAMRFDFVNEFRIRGQFSNIVLLMNGHLIQNFREQFYNSETSLVEINRSFFEQDPKWLQPAPDSLGLDVQAPSIIKERPSSN